jgi:Uma2 family endonuclease
MAILEHEIRSEPNAYKTGMKRRLFTRQEYRTMGESGIFDDQRVELIEGEIVEMAPVGYGHATVTDPLGVLLRTAFGSDFTIRTQVPVALAGRRPSEPQPDIAVVIGSWRDYRTRTPSQQDIKLVVEVADSSLQGDRTVKAALYAEAKIPDYWIVNLIDTTLEVYRDPVGGGSLSDGFNIRTYR